MRPNQAHIRAILAAVGPEVLSAPPLPVAKMIVCPSLGSPPMHDKPLPMPSAQQVREFRARPAKTLVSNPIAIVEVRPAPPEKVEEGHEALSTNLIAARGLFGAANPE